MFEIFLVASVLDCQCILECEFLSFSNLNTQEWLDNWHWTNDHQWKSTKENSIIFGSKKQLQWYQKFEWRHDALEVQQVHQVNSSFCKPIELKKTSFSSLSTKSSVSYRTKKCRYLKPKQVVKTVSFQKCITSLQKPPWITIYCPTAVALLNLKRINQHYFSTIFLNSYVCP